MPWFLCGFLSRLTVAVKGIAVLLAESVSWVRQGRIAGCGRLIPTFTVRHSGAMIAGIPLRYECKEAGATAFWH